MDPIPLRILTITDGGESFLVSASTPVFRRSAGGTPITVIVFLITLHHVHHVLVGSCALVFRSACRSSILMAVFLIILYYLLLGIFLYFMPIVHKKSPAANHPETQKYH